MQTSSLDADADADADADVVIVGAGPVGTALAVDLGQAGVRTLVLERRAESERPHPGTNLTNMRSMEHMRRWGATEHLRAANPLGPEWRRDVHFLTRANGHLILNLEGALDFGEQLPFTSAAPHLGPQESIERGLRRRVAELDEVSILFEAEFLQYEEHDDHVAVSYRDGAGGVHTVRARYVVGADGSRSAVRHQMGVRLEGNANVLHMATYYVRAPGLREVLEAHNGTAAFLWFANEDDTGVIIIAQDSEGVFQIADAPLPAAFDGDDWPAMKRRVDAAIGVELEIEPLEGGDWMLHSLVAPRFSDGRVFLAGEACHLISVFGGFGMNTGIGDVADLGWKLTAAVKGWAGDALLASYDAERIPVVRWIRDLTEESTTHLGSTWTVPGMEEDSPRGAQIRAQLAKRIAGEKQQELVSLGAQFGATHRDSPVVVPDGTTPPVATFGKFEPSASPGCRLPHAWLSGSRSIFDEVALEGFTLLRLDPEQPTDSFYAAARERAVPFKVVTVEEPRLRDLYQAGLVLVRPDHHVAWRGSSAPHDVGLIFDVARGAVRAGDFEERPSDSVRTGA